MALINPDTTLLIAEELPLRDLRSLMLTSRAHNELIRTPDQPHNLLAGFRPLSTPVLSTKSFPHAVLQPATFAVVEELEHRARCAAELVQPVLVPRAPVTAFFRALSGMRPFCGLTQPQWDRLAARIQDTFAIADHIADCEAVVRGSRDLPRPGSVDRSLLDAEVRAAREEAISTLGRLDLAFLALLERFAAFVYLRRDRVLKRRVDKLWCLRAVEEVMLQEGTRATYAVYTDMVYREWERLLDWASAALLNSPWGTDPGEPKALAVVAKEAFPADEVRRLVREDWEKQKEAFWEGWDGDNETDERWTFRIEIVEEDGEDEDSSDKDPTIDPRFWLIRRWLDKGEG